MPQHFIFYCDPLDAAAIHEAVAFHQARDHRVFGEHLLPEHESSTIGATLAEICRDWLDRHKGGVENDK
jgi:hypothetical protein